MMNTEKLKHELTQLDQVLIELEQDDREWMDIIKNMRAAVVCELDWITENENIGLDDYAEIGYTIMATRERMRFLEEHPHFVGSLIQLREAMGEKPSQGAIEAAPDTERTRACTILPPNSNETV